MKHLECSDSLEALDKALLALQQAVADIRQVVIALAVGKKQAMEDLEREWREQQRVERHRQ